MQKIIYYIVFVLVLLVTFFIINFYSPDANDIPNLGEEQGSGRERVTDEVFVYETEAGSADECSSYENFDSENRLCYFECESETECKEVEDEINAELDAWANELENDRKPVQERIIANDDKSLKAEYLVTAGEKITLNSGKNDLEYQRIWDEIKDLSPNTLTDKYIEAYQVFDNKNDDTLAFVDDEDGNGKWRLAVNMAGYKTSTERENKATFIHEIAHIISLNSEQVDSNISEKSCTTFYLEEGCTKSNSYLNNFQNTFWKNLKKNSDGSANFQENKFVTEYAASSEVEDLAESFAFFVLEKTPPTPLSERGEQVQRNEKVNIFYNYPELVNIRNEMRKVLSKDIVRARKIFEK